MTQKRRLVNGRTGGDQRSAIQAVFVTFVRYAPGHPVVWQFNQICRVSSQRAADLRRYFRRHHDTNRIDATTLSRRSIVDGDALRPVELARGDAAALDREVRVTERLTEEIATRKRRIRTWPASSRVARGGRSPGSSCGRTWRCCGPGARPVRLRAGPVSSEPDWFRIPQNTDTPPAGRLNHILPLVAYHAPRRR